MDAGRIESGQVCLASRLRLGLAVGAAARAVVVVSLAVLLVAGLLPRVPQTGSWPGSLSIQGAGAVPDGAGLDDKEPASGTSRDVRCASAGRYIEFVSNEADAADGADGESDGTSGVVVFEELDPPYVFPPLDDPTLEWVVGLCVASDNTWSVAVGGAPVSRVRPAASAAEVALVEAAFAFDFGDTIVRTVPELSGPNGYPLYVNLEGWIEIESASFRPELSAPRPSEGVSIDVSVDSTTVHWRLGDQHGTCDNPGALPPEPIPAGWDEAAPCGFTPDTYLDSVELEVWVEHQITAVGSLTGLTRTGTVEAGRYVATSRVDEVQAFGVDESGEVPVPPPADRSYGSEPDCTRNPLTWGTCAEVARESISRLVVAGGRLIIDAGEVVIDGHRYVINSAWEFTEVIANGLVEGVDLLRRLATGCISAIGDQVDQLVGIAVTLWDFVTDPVGFLETKILGILDFIEVAMADLSGTALDAFKELVNYDDLLNDPIHWIGSTGCNLLIEALTGKIIVKLTKWVDNLLPKKSKKDDDDDSSPPTTVREAEKDGEPEALPSAKPGRVIPGGLAPHERAMAERIVDYRGGEFIGVTRRNEPGIDGTLNGVNVSLKEVTGTSPLSVLTHASKAEKQAKRAGYKNVDLYIDAPNIPRDLLIDFGTRGPLVKIPGQGTISKIYVRTAEGWVVF